MLALWYADPEALRKQIRETRTLTSKPFGVNLNLEFPQDERLEVCLAEKVPIISFFWREPGALVHRAKEAGAIVLHTVGSANMARRAVESGVDVVVAQGWEAGGHVRGTVATLPLIPAVVDAVGRSLWLPPVALLTAADSPPCSHSAPRAHGSAPDFSRARRRPYIRATASGC